MLLAEAAELQREPVLGGAADAGRKRDAIPVDRHDYRIWSVQVMQNRHWRTLPSKFHAHELLLRHLRACRIQPGRLWSLATSTIACPGKQNLLRSILVFVDASDTSYDGLSRLCSYGATKTQIALAIAACPRLKKLGTQSPRVRPGDRRLEARIVYLTLCRSPSADQSPWPSWLLDSRYGSPAGQCCRPAVLCHPQSIPLPTRLT